MPKPTLATRLALGLASYGFREVSSPSRKYRKFTKGSTTFWIGPSGALRYGPTVTSSHSATSGPNYARLLVAGDQRLASAPQPTIPTEQL